MLNIMMNDSDINILIISRPQTFNNCLGSECYFVSADSAGGGGGGEVIDSWVTDYAKIGPACCLN